MKRGQWTWVLFAACTFLRASNAPEDLRVFNAKLSHGERRFQHLVIVPAQVTVNRVGFGGAMGLWEKSDQFEDELTELVARKLSHHVAPVDSTVAKDLGREDRAKLAELQRRYDGVESKISAGGGGIKEGRFTLTDDVAEYGPAAEADTLVFIRGRGNVASKTYKSLSNGIFFVGSIAFVDAHTGELLVFIRFSCDSHPWPVMTDKLESHIDNGFLGTAPFIYGLLGPGLSPPRKKH